MGAAWIVSGVAASCGGEGLASWGPVGCLASAALLPQGMVVAGVLSLLPCTGSFSLVLGGRQVVMLSPVTALCRQKMHLLCNVQPAWKHRYCVYCLPTTTDVSAPLRAGFQISSSRFDLSNLAMGPKFAPSAGREGCCSATCFHRHRLTASLACLASTTGGSSSRQRMRPLSVVNVLASCTDQPSLSVVPMTAAAGP